MLLFTDMDSFARWLISFKPTFLAHATGGLMLSTTRTRNACLLLRDRGLLVRGDEEVCEGVKEMG